MMMILECINNRKKRFIFLTCTAYTILSIREQHIELKIKKNIKNINNNNKKNLLIDIN